MLLLILCCTEPQGVSEVLCTMDLCVRILASGSRCHNRLVSITWNWGYSPALVQVSLFRRSEDKLSTPLSDSDVSSCLGATITHPQYLSVCLFLCP